MAEIASPLRIKINEINLQITEENFLGKGGYGTVIKTSYIGTPVAAKTLHCLSHPDTYGVFPGHPGFENIIKEFENEFSILAKLSHPNVILLMGVVYDETHNFPKWIIQELGESSLSNELKNNPSLHHHCVNIKNSNNNNIDDYFRYFEMNRYALKLKIDIFIDILRGLCYIHNLNIVHRDLKPSNIIKVKNAYKIADLGLAKILQLDQKYIESVVGAVDYVAPEVEGNAPRYTKNCDLYSFGVLMIEAILNERPSKHTRESQLDRAIEIVIEIVSSLPSSPKSSTNDNSMINDELLADRIKSIFRSLLATDNQRPSAVEVLRFMEQLQNRFLSLNYYPQSDDIMERTRRLLEEKIKSNHSEVSQLVKNEINSKYELFDQKLKSVDQQLSTILQILQSKAARKDDLRITTFTLPFRPLHIAVDYNNSSVLISDAESCKIYCYPITRNQIDATDFRIIGREGGNDLQFKYPVGVAVYDCPSTQLKGNIIVVDQNNHRVQICSKNGEFIRKFGSRGSSNGEFYLPYGVAVRSTNDSIPEIAISDSGNHRIQIWNVEGLFIRSIGRQGNGNMQFNYPTGLAIHRRNGNIIIADRDNHRIQICNWEGKFIRSFGGFGSGDRQFNAPRGVALLYSKHLQGDQMIICDFGNHRIQICSMEGEFIRFLGCFGRDRSQFNNTLGVAVLRKITQNNNNDDNNNNDPRYSYEDDDDESSRIIVADFRNYRIQIIENRRGWKANNSSLSTFNLTNELYYEQKE